jgi:ABC-2 type transport system permease protein
MIPMLRKALWDLRWTATWYAVGGAGYTLLVASFYPTVRQQSAQFHNLIATYPKGMLNALGYTDLTSFTGYMGVETLNLLWPIIAIVFATLAGAALVAKEVEDGTSETWLSAPAARWRLLLGKSAALAIGLLAIIVANAAAVGIAAAATGSSIKGTGLVAMVAVTAAFLFVIAAYSSLFSSILSVRGIVLFERRDAI